MFVFITEFKSNIVNISLFLHSSQMKKQKNFKTDFLQFENGDVYVGEITQFDIESIPSSTKSRKSPTKSKVTRAHGYGCYYYNDGSKFQGSFKLGLKHGAGTFTFHTDEQFIGTFVDDKRQGKGLMTWKNGDSFEGIWVDDQQKGQGIIKVKSTSCVYEGECLNCQKHGFGKMKYDNGDSYIGFFKQNVKHGYGKFIQHQGQYVTGEWKDGKISLGKVTFPNRYEYEGELHELKFHGKGKLTDFTKQTVHEGMFEDNMLVQGRKHQVDNFLYEGSFVNQRFEGQGKLTLYPKDDIELLVFEGTFTDGYCIYGTLTTSQYVYYGGFTQQGLKDGPSVLITNDGTRYEGTCVNDVFEGHCTVNSTQYSYVGNVENSIQQGQGIYHDKKRNYIFEGQFNANHFLRGTFHFQDDNQLMWYSLLDCTFENDQPPEEYLRKMKFLRSAMPPIDPGQSLNKLETSRYQVHSLLNILSLKS